MKMALAWIAEERIRQAQARGEFDDLPGQGRPLVFDDDPLAPEELRVAWRLLKGAGIAGPGTRFDGPMPNSFAAMMSLIDRARDRGDSRDGHRFVLMQQAAEARRRRWRADDGS